MKLKMKRHYLVILLISLVSIIVGIIWGSYYYSQSQTWLRTANALKNDNDMQYFKSTNAHLRINHDTLQPLQMAFRESCQNKQKFLETNPNVQFKVTGKHWLIFNKYQLVIKPINLHITTNHQHTQLKINHHNYGYFNYHYQLNYLVPGQYYLQTDYHGQTNHTTLLIKQSKKIDMAVKKVNFKITGYPYAKIYLNQHYYATLNQNGQYNLHCPWSSHLMMQQIYQGKAGKVASQIVNLGNMDRKISVTVNYPRILNQLTARTWLTILVSTLNNNPQLLSCFFVNGSKNTSYQTWLKTNNYLTNPNVESVSYQAKLQQVLPLKISMTSLVFDVESIVNDTNNNVNRYKYEYTVIIKGFDSNDHADLIQKYKILKINKIILLKY